MSETNALRWVKASERLPVDPITRASRYRLGNGDFKYSSLIVEGERVFMGEENTFLIDEMEPEIFDNWEWLEEYTPDVPDTNPGDMPSRHVDGPKAYVQESLICNNGKSINVRYPAPSKEGASQSPNLSVKEQKRRDLENLIGGLWEADNKSYGQHAYRLGALAMHAHMDDKLCQNAWEWIQRCNDLQSQLSSMTDNYQRVVAERDNSYEENRRLLLKTGQLRKVENETNTEEIMELKARLSSMTERKDAALSLLAEAKRNFDVILGNDARQEGEIEKLTAERDLLNNQYQFAQESSSNWRKEAFALAALLEGKNLEIAQLKEENAAYRNALEPGTSVMTQIEILEKYKKEEQK